MRTSPCYYLTCSWRNALWLNAMHCGKKWWIREFVAPIYISFKSWLCCCSLPAVAPQQIFLSSSPLTSHKLSSGHLLFLKVSECKKKIANDELRLPRSSSAKTLFGWSCLVFLKKKTFGRPANVQPLSKWLSFISFLTLGLILILLQFAWFENER